MVTAQAKTLEETAAKREGIAEVLDSIEARLGELEGEKDELQRYERLDREHRALQHVRRAGETGRGDADLSEETGRGAAAAGDVDSP